MHQVTLRLHTVLLESHAVQVFMDFTLAEGAQQLAVPAERLPVNRKG